jgi:hypothetical protein
VSTYAGQPLRHVPGRGLLSIGSEGAGVWGLYLGLGRAAILDALPDGRYRMRKPRLVFDSLDAACDWLCTPAGAPLSLSLTPPQR